MSLFQKSVLNKYLKAQDHKAVEEAFSKYSVHFLNFKMQQEIKEMKEEEYQDGFLDDLFVNVLGYIKRPKEGYNLIREKKNETDGKKADGAILINDKAVAVIELKGTDTTDLNKVETQAFGYKNNQPNCTYIITSNFEKLRFYIDNAVDFEEFNLFNLSKEAFQFLWLCLSSDNLLKDIPKRIKNESIAQEENITKKLYNDYSLFRNEIFDSIQKKNTTYDKLILFRKTQKLLDRFLFIFFAEDRLLLSPNSIRIILNQWTDLRDKYDAYQPLYSRFKQYFGYLNTGHKGDNHDIFAYNGGLFAPDPVLDEISIDDDILFKHTVKLSKYDFESDVSVNILGHIFEHSLTEIEDIEAELKGLETDHGQSKRKNEGVFYTPKYITKYIVDNTLGKLCDKQKRDLEIEESEYEKKRKGRHEATLKKLDQKLGEYREWLLNLTICDPACGSGAFLNQALEFLINEHRYVDELQTKLLGYSMVLMDRKDSILENNLYGVDINEEAIDIAKLALWLRTAQKGRKLTSLNDNIKCGNSLIDDSKVAGEKAFNWEEEFPKVFNNGGFDVIIGNPPYVSANNMDYNTRQYFNSSESFECLKGKWDLYIPFLEKPLKLLKPMGRLSFIIPFGLLNQPFGEIIRRYIIENYVLESIVDLHDTKVFADATVPTCIPTILKESENDYDVKILKRNIDSIDFSYSFNISYYHRSEQFMFRTEDMSTIGKVLDKIKTKSKNKRLQDFLYVSTGAEIHGKEKRSDDGKLVSGHSKFDVLFDEYQEGFKEYIEGSAIEKSKYGRYSYPKRDFYLNYTPHIMRSPKFPELFDSNKIIIRGSSGLLGILATLDERKLYTPHKITIGIPHDLHPTRKLNHTSSNRISLKFLLAILNSRLIGFYYKSVFGGFIDVYPNNLKKIPIVKCDNEEEIVSKVDKILKAQKDFRLLKDSFSNYFISKYQLLKPTNKLNDWFDLDFGIFLKELNKVIKKEGGKRLSKLDEMEWMEVFEIKKNEAKTLKAEIDKTDEEIDQLVYDLYDLTEEEIKLVEQH